MSEPLVKGALVWVRHSTWSQCFRYDEAIVTRPTSAKGTFTARRPHADYSDSLCMADEGQTWVRTKSEAEAANAVLVRAFQEQKLATVRNALKVEATLRQTRRIDFEREMQNSETRTKQLQAQIARMEAALAAGSETALAASSETEE